MKSVNANIVEGMIYEIQWLVPSCNEWECRAFTTDLNEARNICRFKSKSEPSLEWRIVRVTRKVVAK